MLKLGIDPEKPPLYASTAYVVAIWPSFLFNSYVKIWDTCENFFGQMVYRPPLAKNFPYAYVWLVIMTGCFNIFVVPYDHFFCKWLGIVLYILNLRPVEEW